MSDSKHTPTPWIVSKMAEHSFAATITDVNGGVLIAKTVGFDTFHECQNCDEENANARHIVACVNACEGIETEWLEKTKLLFTRDAIDKIAILRAQNARLREALERILAFDLESDGATCEWVELIAAAIHARAALAETEQTT